MKKWRWNEKIGLTALLGVAWMGMLWGPLHAQPADAPVEEMEEMPSPSKDDVVPPGQPVEPPPVPEQEAAIPGADLPPDSAEAAPTGEDTMALSLPGASQDEYVIQSGDTLWDISSRFFAKPEFWPRLWSYNQYITNPHWIYPGNRLVFKPGSETIPPSVEVKSPTEGIQEPPTLAEIPPGETKPGEPVEAGGEHKEGEMTGETVALEPVDEGGIPSVAGQSPLSHVGRQVTLREDGYISKSREKSIGRITGSFLPIHRLSQSQEVYLTIQNKDQVQVGDLFTVYREEKRVGGAGYLNKVLGSVEVTEIQPQYVKAIIQRSYYDIERGDKIREYSNPFHSVQVKEAATPMKGKIIERLLSDAVDIGSGDVVYIDRGNRDGVEPGYEFKVVRRGDGVELGSSSKYPDEVVGRLVVVVARENNSTAVVVHSTNALHVGDRILTHLNQ